MVTGDRHLPKEEPMTASDRTPEMAKRERIIREMTDDLDEELELELDDSRFDELLDETDALGPTVDRRLYFRELLRLQGELVKLQDWVQSEKKKVVVLFEGRDSAGKGGFIMRITDPLKQWKLSPMDVEARSRWEAYTKAKETMLEHTHLPDSPWWIV